MTGLNFSQRTWPAGIAFTDVLRDGKWSSAKVAWPKRTKTSRLLALSCLSATWCIAAGPLKESELDPLGALWNGKTWSLKVI